MQPWLTGSTNTAEEQLENYPQLKDFINQGYSDVWGNTGFRLLERNRPAGQLSEGR